MLWKKYDILSYITAGYESFHLTGDLGVAEEIEQYIKKFRDSVCHRQLP